MQRIIINTNVATQEHYDENGFSIRGGSPRIVANSEFMLTWNLYSATPGANRDGADVSTWTRHTGYAGCTARLGCDDDWMHRVSGTYAGEAITAGGAVPSTLTVTINGATDQNLSFSGLVTLYNASGEYETFLYTSRTISGNTVSFNVGSGLTAEHSYSNGNTATCSQELFFQASADPQLSNPGNGIFVFKVRSTSTKLKKIIDTINGEVIGIQGLELLPFSVDGTTVTQYPSLFLDTPILVTTMQEVGTPDQIPDSMIDPIGEEVAVLLQSGISQEIWNPVSSSWSVYSGGSGEWKGRYWLTGGGSGASKTEFPLIQGPQGNMPTISAGSASSLPAGSAPTVDVVSSGSGYTINLGIPSASDGITPVLSGGTVTTLPAGSSASAEIVSSGESTYYINLSLPRGSDGQNGSMAFPIQSYSSDSAYSSMTCITYNGGGYQVTSDTTAGENPDNAASKFICFASSGAVGSTGPAGSNGSDGAPGSDGSNGSDGISPIVSVTQLSSGARIITSDALGETAADILNGSDGHLAAAIQEYSSDSAYAALSFLTYNGGGYQVVSATNAGENPDNTPGKFLCFASSGTSGSNGSNGSDGHLVGARQVVSSLVSGAIVLEDEAVPVAVLTSAGNLYYLEKGSIAISSGAWSINPAPYLAYDNVSSFSGPWTVYFAGGLPEPQTIHSGGSAIVPQEHQAYQVSLTSGTAISIDSSGLSSSTCMTFELWLDMPSSSVSFTLPAFTWIDGAAPDFTSGSTRYAVAVRWDGSDFLANLAYEKVLS